MDLNLAAFYDLVRAEAKAQAAADKAAESRV